MILKELMSSGVLVSFQETCHQLTDIHDDKNDNKNFKMKNVRLSAR